MRIVNDTVFVNNKSMSTSWVSDGFSLKHMIGFSCTARITGGASPNGTFSLEISNEGLDSNNDSPTNAWVTLSDSSQAITTDGNIIWSVSLSQYRWVRVRFVRSSGDGSCDILINPKGLD